MYNDFIPVKHLTGDLVISHKKRDYGLTVSTKELIIHKPHINYYILLEHIVSIVPFEMRKMKEIRFISKKSINHEITNMSIGLPHYKCSALHATVHNRSGIFQLGDTEFIVPIHDQIVAAISYHGNFQSI